MTHSMLAISGSLRAASSNTGLARLAQRLAPPELTIELYQGIGDLPLYNADLDVAGKAPPVVAAWRAAFGAADAVLFVAPEYNWSATPAMKNAFDWASRPFEAKPLVGKVMTLMSSAGKGGGRKVQAYFSEILPLLGAVLISEPEVAVVGGVDSIRPDGTTTDPTLEGIVTARLANVVAALAAR